MILLDDGGGTVAVGDVPTDPADTAGTLSAAGRGGGRHRACAAWRWAWPARASSIRTGATSAARPTCPAGRTATWAACCAGLFRGLPTALANDVNAALYGEYRAGAGRGCRDLVMIALGTGVGGGVLLDGHLLVGTHFGAGEIGHMVLDPAGPVCTCGNRGCLEAWAGSRALLAQGPRTGGRRTGRWPSWCGGGTRS